MGSRIQVVADFFLFLFLNYNLLLKYSLYDERVAMYRTRGWTGVLGARNTLLKGVCIVCVWGGVFVLASCVYVSMSCVWCVCVYIVCVCATCVCLSCVCVSTSRVCGVLLTLNH